MAYFNNTIFASISESIITPSALRKQIEEEERVFLKKVEDIVNEINADIRYYMQLKKHGFVFTLPHITKDGEICTENKLIVNILKDMYCEKGYQVEVEIDCGLAPNELDFVIDFRF